VVVTDRSKKIVRTSVIGIIVNVILVGFKAAVGFFAGSISIILDAVNNLSDALSSVITIVGTKLAGKKPDKKHPFGYGRIEYITSVIIAVIVLIAGFTSMKESIEKIISPTETNYTVISAVIIAVAVLVKCLLGLYVRKTGKALDSGALIASGSDALFDAIISFATLVGIIINMIWSIALEGILGALISVFIIKSGFEMLIDTLNSIIGTRADPELTRKLRDYINSFDGVLGTYDMTLHNYGPTHIIASAHIEVDDGATARELHMLTRKISAGVYGEFGIILTVGVYASNADSEKGVEIKEAIMKEAAKHEGIIEVHGFYLDPEASLVTFDLVTDFKADAVALRDVMVEAMKEKYPEYSYFIVLDSDYSD